MSNHTHDEGAPENGGACDIQERSPFGSHDEGLAAADLPPAPAALCDLGQQAPSPWRFIAPPFILIFVILVFVPALCGTFVNWDDSVLLNQNDSYKGFTGESIKWMFTTRLAGHYHPLTWLSYAFDDFFWNKWGFQPFGFHFTNVFLHALGAVAFYFVSRRLLVLGFADNKAHRSNIYVLAAAIAALLFAVHPLRAESVAWLAERRDVLSGLFYVLCIGCYLRYASPKTESTSCEPSSESKSDAPNKGSTVFLVLAIVFCLFSLLSKAAAVTLFLVLIVLDFYPLRRLPVFGPLAGKKTLAILAEKIPFALLSLVFGLIAISAQDQAGALQSLSVYGPAERFAQATYGLMFYLWKTVWPANLGPMYQIPPQHALLGTMLWTSGLVVTVIAFVVVLRRRTFPALAAALAAYVVIVMPVLGFAQSGRQLVADRYSYLSCMGLAVAAAALLIQQIQKHRAAPNGRQKTALITLAAVAIVFVLSAKTRDQAAHWTDPMSLWRHAVQVNSHSSIAHVNYADTLSQVARLQSNQDSALEAMKAAISHYQAALKIDPDDAIAWHHLADAQLAIGNKPAAKVAYVRALSKDDTRKAAYLPFARLLLEDGQAKDALKTLRFAAEQMPQQPDVIRLLAEVLATYPDASIRNGAEAVRHAEKLIQDQESSDPRLLLTLACAYAEVGRFDEAIQQTQSAIELINERGNEALLSQANSRLELFKQGKPYHWGE